MKKFVLLFFISISLIASCGSSSDDSSSNRNDEDTVVKTDADGGDQAGSDIDNDTVSDATVDPESDEDHSDGSDTNYDDSDETDEENHDVELSDDDTSAESEKDDDTPAGDCSSFDSDDAVVKNGSFEHWNSSSPNSWVGSKTNVGAELGDNVSEINEYSKSSKSCATSCQLVNRGDKHARLTTAGRSMKSGEYTCSYWVRGNGEIRNGFYDGESFSSYSGYTLSAGNEWKKILYSFKLNADVEDSFELIFSFRNTGAENDDLQIDDVACERTPEFCDTVTCDEWETCSNQEKACVAVEGRCNDKSDCNEWEQCSGDHTCELTEGRCNSTADCDVDGGSPVCDKSTHSCVAGDPCAGVVCDSWKECDPNTALCVLSDGRCDRTTDCVKSLPACRGEDHTCVAADDQSNVIKNGGFEQWDIFTVPYHGDDNNLPISWYGLDFEGGDNTAKTEMKPEFVVQEKTVVHSGSSALQINFTKQPADRFTSEGMDIPAGNYSCHYFVKGKGDLRHRWYSKQGWAKDTEFVSIDSSDWVEIPFKMNFATPARAFRFIFYVSNTVAPNHIIIDDLVCTAY